MNGLATQESIRLSADRENTATAQTTPWDAKVFGFNTGMIADLAIASEDGGRRLLGAIDDWAAAKALKCVTVTVAIGDLRAIHLLEAAGFHYYETKISPTVKLDGYEIDENALLPLRPAGPGDQAAIEQIALRSISHGHFHHDPNLGAGLASDRYREWARNLINEGTNDIFVLDDDQGGIRAFMICRRAKDTVEFVLGGFAEENHTGGLGYGFCLTVLQTMKARGLKKVVTTIALSNLPVLSLYSRLRFKLIRPEVTLRKWYQA
ncbi:MAG: hypothetical protein WC529_07065 [Candidatus Margulisiibacteriota bacterium]